MENIAILKKKTGIYRYGKFLINTLKSENYLSE